MITQGMQAIHMTRQGMQAIHMINVIVNQTYDCPLYLVQSIFEKTWKTYICLTWCLNIC